MGGWPSPLMRKSINHRNSVKIRCFSPVKSPSSTSNSWNFPHWIDEVHVHHENHHIFPMKITIFCWWTLTPIHHHSHLRARPHRPRRWHHPGIRGQWRAAPTPGVQHRSWGFGGSSPSKIWIFSGKNDGIIGGFYGYVMWIYIHQELGFIKKLELIRMYVDLTKENVDFAASNGNLPKRIVKLTT